MVQKIWSRSTFGRWLPTKPEKPHPRVFSEPRFQNESIVWYLIYRCLIMSAWIAIIVFSILGIGSGSTSGGIGSKWPIYLTHWDLVLGTIQSIAGFAIVIKRWKFERTNDDSSSMKFGILEMFYWYVYVSTCTVAIGVTMIYWLAIHTPDIPINYLNIMVHVCNSVLMIIDICVTSVPLIVFHFWWPLTIALTYAIFSLTYYLAGGLDLRGLTYIYDIMNWETPGKTLIACFLITIFLIVVHCGLCVITNFGQLFNGQTREKYVLESSSNVTTDRRRPTVNTIEIA